MKDYELLRPREVQNLLGITRAQLLWLVNTGELEFVRTPGGHRRYDPNDIKRVKTAMARRKN